MCRYICILYIYVYLRDVKPPKTLRNPVCSAVESAQESRSQRLHLDYESSPWLQGYWWTCQVAWYDWWEKNLMNPKSAKKKICQSRKCLRLGCFFVASGTQGPLLSITGWPLKGAPSRSSGPVVQNRPLRQPLAMIKSGNTRMVLRKGQMDHGLGSTFLSLGGPDIAI